MVQDNTEQNHSDSEYPEPEVDEQQKVEQTDQDNKWE